MHVVIRLQNHGCRNHKFWWIVVAPRKRNVKGRFIEHLGYWVPHERKVVQRSVILNKPRIRYWLAQGAGVTPKIHRFLSWIDLLPPPLIKFGSKTLYEKPKTPISVDTFKPFNRPFQSSIEYQFLDKINENQVNNDLKRKILYSQQKVEEIPATSVELEKEWDRLRAEVYQIEKDNKAVNPEKKELVFKKINEIAKQWFTEKQMEGLKQLSQEKANIKVDNKNLKEQIMIQNLAIQTQKSLEDKQTWINDLIPLNQDEAFRYILKVRKRVRAARIALKRIYDFAYASSQVVSRAFIDDFLRNRNGRQKVVPNEQHKDLKHDIIETMHYIPVNRPVHPLPDFEAYDPEEYTDVKRQSEQLIKNKSYSIPNVYLEPDQVEPQLNRHTGGYIKGQGGRKTKARAMAKISTLRKKAKNAYQARFGIRK
ncbi:unnamed protein product (macronuclear) [Paramecium tetraurelia]|uniref:Ribosomal protein S16 n=1 Tax=Paramecium tetraurelia TaxID=5888 RepID=A0BD97_PARTE|nr:uncharacterized protein GSPATT00004608001 [Paramecium tetraurelia]CAK56514.1 unnamed protein product [Paramecium tetraurelia]|eukprot:XP_001423912.1 hypothetical protein (macronuclear) [Paramecium tetraurelia strain d4-2]